jgi:hypothetical protein
MGYEFKDEAHLKGVLENNGYDPLSGGRMEFTDILNTSNAGPLLPKVIVSIIKEAQEPLLIGTSLLDPLPYQYGQTVVFPAMGAMVAEDIPEGGEYPEHQPQLGGATVTANVGKVGMAFGFTEEMLRYSQFDLMGLYMRQAGRAMARHKEEKIFRHVLSMGVVCFDNADPSGSIFGVTTGRDLSGAANGSMIMDDLFDILAQMMHQGFMPNTILIHPLAWLMWVKDPTMRAFALQAGGGSFFQQWQGEVVKQFGPDNGPQGKQGLSGGQGIIPGGAASGEASSGIEEYNQTMTSAPSIPGYFPFPFRIIVSPFMPFDPDTLLTDIIVFQSGELGALLVDEDLTTDEWTDPRVDVRKIKLRERYGLGIYNEGLGVGVAKNIKIVPNQVVLPASATISVSGDITEIDPGTAVV